LIDFSKLAADISVANQDGTLNQHQQTMVDYGANAGDSFTAAQKEAMKSSLAIANWDVTLASSSRTVGNQVLTFVKEVTSQANGTVMGVRVHFPVEPHNSWALIKPPFEIPAYDYSTVDAEGNIVPADSRSGASRFEAPAGDGGRPDLTQAAYGVVKNVGTVKSLAVTVYGLNFPHSLSAILIDSEGKEKIIHIGYLNFDGWRQLTWENPAYVTEVRNRELRLYPLYPSASPYVKFGGFLIQRDAAREGGDFIAYFKDVKIIYDKAELESGRDIDDENEWGIINKREDDKQKFEMENFGQSQVYRFQEQQKQAIETGFTPAPAAANTDQ
jgi:hypothetical protein